VRENCTPGSVRGAPRKGRSYRDGKIFAPVYAEQANVAQRMACEIERQEQNFAIQKMRIAKLEKKYASAKTSNLLDIEAELEQARADLIEPESAPRFTGSDVTPESLATILFQNGGRLGVLDAEGAGPLANALGRYSDTGTKLENLLRAYRGDTMQVDRRGRHETIFAPCLTLALALQIGVLRRIGSHPEAREQGFAARFMYSIPKSKAGTRFYSSRKIDRAAESAWNTLLTRLLQIPAVKTVSEPPNFPDLDLTGNALEVWRGYHDETERAMSDGGPLADCRDFAGKLAGHAARLAGLLSFVESGADAIGNPVPVHAVESAVVLMRDYFQPHGLAAYDLMFERAEGSIPDRIVDWIRRHRGDPERFPVFSRTVLYRNLRNGDGVDSPADLDGPLALLVERGYCRKLEPEHDGPGRPACDRYEVNPEFSAHRKQAKYAINGAQVIEN
jgi:replicative DNA helicase